MNYRNFRNGGVIIKIFNLLKKSNKPNYFSVKNKGLKAVSQQLKTAAEDTVFVTTSRICPVCSVYNRRIYTLFGRYGLFPILPNFLTYDVCPNCNKYIVFARYFPNINGNLERDVEFSNRPFLDSRTTDEKKIWDDNILAIKLKEKMERDYDWVCVNLSYMAPKSIGGYKRMAKSNSENFQNLVCAAKNKGYII